MLFAFRKTTVLANYTSLQITVVHFERAVGVLYGKFK